MLMNDLIVSMFRQGFDGARYSHPWGALVRLNEAGRPQYDFSAGKFNGDEKGGDIIISAQPGDIVAVGIRDMRGPDSKNDWYRVRADGALEPVGRERGLAYLQIRPRSASSSQTRTPRPISRTEVPLPPLPQLALHFARLFREGRSFDTIIDARKVAGEILGEKIEPGTVAAKIVEEHIELGAVLASRELITAMRRDGKDDMAVYRALVDLYRRMPVLGTRTSTSMDMQAYSTPVPLAFLASRIAGVSPRTTVYEPTAGNGALLLEARPRLVLANELDPERVRNLQAQGFSHVSNEDATARFPAGNVDRILANPPFGRKRDESGNAILWNAGSYRTPELDHAVLFQALEAMQDNGRAVLIIGGHKGNDAMKRADYRAALQTQFYKQLFETYTVEDHFTASGALYSRQGASWPVDFLVIGGRGRTTGRPFPGAELPRVYNTFESLEEVLHGHMVDPAEWIVGDDFGDSGRVGRPNRGSGAIAGAGGNENRQAASGEPGGAGRDGRHSDGPGNAGEPVRAATDAGKRDGNPDHDPSEMATAGTVQDGGQVPDSVSSTGNDNREPGSGGNLLGMGGPNRPVSTEFQVPYKTASNSYSMNTLVPKNMAAAVEDALERVRKQHGDIDEFVARELDYQAEDLPKYFGAEQVDAIALAIHNIKENSGFIIGDQTGIGKGRVNAAVIRWAKLHDKLPVFITMNPELYVSMVEDLADIGMPGFNPLPTNNGLNGENSLRLHDGRILTTQSGAGHQVVLQDALDSDVQDYDAVFTTYKQLAALGKKPSPRRDFLRGIAHNALFILDESHNAGGEISPSNRNNIASFVRSLLQDSHNGVFYSSATYAKRPDNMPLYFRTDMSLAVDDSSRLAEAVGKGGIPMQQAVAVMLAQSGQYIRRERSLEGADVQSKMVEIGIENAENFAAIMRGIMDFDRLKQIPLARLDSAAATVGNSVRKSNTTGKSGAESTNFTSVMHNVISQSLLAQKADAVVQEAEKIVKRGEKVVIALSNTMGSLIAEYAADNDLLPGDQIDLTYKDLFLRYLWKSREVIFKDATGRQAGRRPMADEELGPHALKAYNKVKEFILDCDFGPVPISPIDYLLHALKRKGIGADEITGRTAVINYSSGVPTYALRKTGSGVKQSARNKFNDGEIDVLVINQAGSTGINLHASEKFNDQRRRNMIIAQPELDINVFMQTLGRVFRTGQVVPPNYQLLFSNLPAEKRVSAVLNKKMGSLNANTTADKNSETSFKDTPDFLNKYGDMVAEQLMMEDPLLNRALGEPVAAREETEAIEVGGGYITPNAMRRVTGRIPVLPVARQEEVYQILESEYNDLIAQKEAFGGTGLEAKSLPLDAKLVASTELTPAKEVGKKTPFADASFLCTYDVKRLGKPYSSDQVRKLVEEGVQSSSGPVDCENAIAEWFHKKKLAQVAIMGEAALQDELDEAAKHAIGRVMHVLTLFRPGDAVAISDQNMDLQGIVTRIRRNERIENAAALSAWRMEVAVADAAKNCTLTFSQILKGKDKGGVNLAKLDDPEKIYARFDASQSLSREKIQIATGNILAAYDKLLFGKICTFSDQDGSIIPGIVLPRGTKPEEILNAVDISLNPGQAIKFLQNVPGPWSKPLTHC